MKIIDNIQTLNQYLLPFWANSTRIGFVPTMGALHKGHLSLIEKSIANNSVTIVSIFVNPTQFNNKEDLKNYPRTLDVDALKISTVSNDVVVFAPTADAIYDGNIVSKSFDFDGLENQMEGAFRPGHFDGVGTIVKRLFEIIKPTNAYFGEKDFQQLQIVKKMVQKEKLLVNIVQCAIYRENNGLAMSSRNERLTNNERDKAKIIYKILLEAKKKFGTNSANEVKKWVTKRFETIDFLKLEYFQIADEQTLLPLQKKANNKKYRAFIAVFYNNIRLIDTISLN